MDDRESFFQRWSRRKLDRPSHEAEREGETKPLVDGDLPAIDFDALDFNSDYARFMLPQTSHSLRSQALRKLWASNPVFTEPDGLQDYAKDYTDAGATLGDAVKSLYRIGKGFMTDEEFGAWAELAVCSTQAEVCSGDQERQAEQTLRGPHPQTTAETNRASGSIAASDSLAPKVVPERAACGKTNR